ncbi:MAG: cobalt transporter CbiM [Chloroflexi bacterium]|nr:cobalt transporter CbiM [Chloroflexota bacterium]
MHIPDGILPTSVLVGGYAVTGVATWLSLRKINQQANPQAGVPKAALLTAAFFVASWIHIPVPPTSVHLVLNGLLGVVLGYYAFPAILIGLFLQAIMFQHGGLTTLGVNAAMMGIPALLAYGLFRLGLRLAPADPASPKQRTIIGAAAFVAGAVGLALAAFIAFSLLITTIPATLAVEMERAAVTALTLAHLPLALIEGVFTVFVVAFLLRVKPEMMANGRKR